MQRIGIAQGFGISFTNDGRPISHGKSDPEALRILTDWLKENPSHEHHENAKRWFLAKQKELAEEDGRDGLFRETHSS